ncbi:TPA: hypothetical protein I7784_21755 [Vibrio vulnificus]|nr:hypothetical protein [Vibrio vulnificus]
MKEWCILLVSISSLSHAGVSTPPLKYTYVEQSITVDSFDNERDAQNLFQVAYEYMELSLSINTEEGR